MKPMHSVSYYLELRKPSFTSPGSSHKPLVHVPADQQLNPLLPIERIKAGLTEIALAFVFVTGVMTFALACFFFLQRF
jgi:hypothetical protein